MTSTAASHWNFVIAAYGVTAIGTALVLVQSWLAMRAAERRATALKQRGDDAALNRRGGDAAPSEGHGA